ncbi:unnamed protein product [Didymodactylos carnosus]|nr:unnamed protein product [Didymodactylos carnosus]CAF4549184.1 unnamed protein product [Didymodactylos carnosus]
MNDSSSWSPAQQFCAFDFAVTGDKNFAQSSLQAAQVLTELKNTIDHNPPEFDSALPLERSVREGDFVQITFTANNAQPSLITYNVTNKPPTSSFDETTGLFEWHVPKIAGRSSASSKQAMIVQAKDALSNMTSTHDVLFNIEPKLVSKAVKKSTKWVIIIIMIILETFEC